MQVKYVWFAGVIYEIVSLTLKQTASVIRSNVYVRLWVRGCAAYTPITGRRPVSALLPRFLSQKYPFGGRARHNRLCQQSSGMKYVIWAERATLTFPHFVSLNVVFPFQF